MLLLLLLSWYITIIFISVIINTASVSSSHPPPTMISLNSCSSCNLLSVTFLRFSTSAASRSTRGRAVYCMFMRSCEPSLCSIVFSALQTKTMNKQDMLCCFYFICLKTWQFSIETTFNPTSVNMLHTAVDVCPKVCIVIYDGKSN